MHCLFHVVKINLVNILFKCTVLIERLILLARYSREKIQIKVKVLVGSFDNKIYKIVA